ncbi:poly-gamma-glutamate hydrolase family protein [Streptomyces antimicrobicus]|uniref:Poly-gamma-glutamate hydrolase family protein n=1 Tax=Streptomyces antimicrobicus TaxID=2883108 RepID=A0ABS8BAS3_9ACTN|nr:poly-gamma-glutamate hydrolase family protein [Streptomyces antimicrobicus]MCB5181721.1 poly-gamma-glutamate hydrolase family protein [Streptomyces antimicrobicus]
MSQQQFRTQQRDGGAQASGASRRSLLAGLAAAAVGGSVLSAVTGGTAYATSADDRFASNTDMYRAFAASADPADGEGKDFVRRFKRHQIADFDRDGHPPYMLTTVLAIHGGGIEVGTSELCLGIAGYDPEPVNAGQRYPGLAAAEPVYDFWMLEGTRSSNNSELHVTSVHCDDHMALSMAASSLNTLSVHGLRWEQAHPAYADNPGGLPDKKGVVVGGRDATFRDILTRRLKSAGFQIFPGSGDVNGDEELNICNRTMTGRGAQLELTRELRDSFFAPSADSPADRGTSCKANAQYKKFVQACRAAIVEREALQRAEFVVGR